MGTCLEALRNYFEARNRAWVTADVDALASAMQMKSGSAGWQQAISKLQGKQRELEFRRSRLLRTHSRVQIQRLEEDDKHQVHAHVDEHITWVYRDGHDFGVEARVIHHKQRWQRRNGKWVLEKNWESDESQPGTIPLVLPSLSATDRQTELLRAREANRGVYDRVRSLKYAELWWNGWNPSFPRLADNCTNFVSQCLWAGGMPMRGGESRAEGWWFKFEQQATAEPWSYSWTTSNALYQYLMYKTHASTVRNARELHIGDLIFYDWDGTGKFHHSTIVTDFDLRGNPLVNANTDASYHRHYLYLDSRAWTENTRYAFVHVPDAWK